VRKKGIWGREWKAFLFVTLFWGCNLKKKGKGKGHKVTNGLVINLRRKSNILRWIIQLGEEPPASVCYKRLSSGESRTPN
jgi:hypothetical protein